MSLIQNALEKASRSTADHPIKPSVPAAAKAVPAAQKSVKTPVLSKPETVSPARTQKPALKPAAAPIRKSGWIHEKSNRSVLIFSAGIMVTAFLVFLALAFIFSSPKGVVVAPIHSMQSNAAIVKPRAAAKPKNIKLFQLSGITFSGSERLALINNQVLGVGDKLPEGAVVKDISEETVTLDYEGRAVELSIR